MKKALFEAFVGLFAEEEGFEPPVPLGTTVFKTAAIDHSATPLGCKLAWSRLFRFAKVILFSFFANASWKLISIF